MKSTYSSLVDTYAEMEEDRKEKPKKVAAITPPAVDKKQPGKKVEKKRHTAVPAGASS
jgi:hypothetical protein